MQSYFKMMHCHWSHDRGVKACVIYRADIVTAVVPALITELLRQINVDELTCQSKQLRPAIMSTKFHIYFDYLKWKRTFFEMVWTAFVYFLQ